MSPQKSTIAWWVTVFGLPVGCARIGWEVGRDIAANAANLDPVPTMVSSGVAGLMIGVALVVVVARFPQLKRSVTLHGGTLLAVAIGLCVAWVTLRSGGDATAAASFLLSAVLFAAWMETRKALLRQHKVLSSVYAALPNLVRDGDFGQVGASPHWRDTWPNEHYQVIGRRCDAKEHLFGTHSLLCAFEPDAIPNGKDPSCGASQAVALNQEDRPRTIVARAWSKCEGVGASQPGTEIAYKIMIDAGWSKDHKHWYGDGKDFSQGTHDWEMQEVRWSPPEPIESCMVTVLLRGPFKGRAWFDGVCVYEL